MPRDLRVLVVEDQPESLQILEEAMRLGGLFCDLVSASNGESALEFLQEPGCGLPDLILLDLNLPALSGHDVLKAVKSDARLRSIPVIVLSSSEAPDDVNTSYEWYANAYVVKPVGLDGVLKFVAVLRSFWFELAALPFQDEPARAPAAIASLDAAPLESDVSLRFPSEPSTLEGDWAVAAEEPPDMKEN